MSHDVPFIDTPCSDTTTGPSPPVCPCWGIRQHAFGGSVESGWPHVAAVNSGRYGSQTTRL